MHHLKDIFTPGMIILIIAVVAALIYIEMDRRHNNGD